jgi:hypothetical protein
MDTHPPAKRSPSEYFKTNILVDCMGFSPIGLRAAIEMCGVDRVVFGSDYGPIPYGIKEHAQFVEDVPPSPIERALVFWRRATGYSVCAYPIPSSSPPIPISSPSKSSIGRLAFTNLSDSHVLLEWERPSSNFSADPTLHFEAPLRSRHRARPWRRCRRGARAVAKIRSESVS